MKTLTIFLPILWLPMLCACAPRPARPGGITYFVGKECHASAQMVGCDQASPPDCKRIALHYDRACEQIVARNPR